MRYLLLLMLATTSLASPSYSAPSDFPIAVIDVVRVLSQSDGAQNIEKQREVMRSAFLSEISDLEQGLRKEEQALSKEGPKLSQEEYAQRRIAYEEKLIEMRKTTQEKKRLMEEASAEAMSALREQLYSVVQEIANERGYKLVISNKDVITGEKSLDITEETMARLNKRVQQISLKIKEK